MNKYKKLLGNTAIFAVGTFSSKILVFFMMRYYTSVLTQADFGISETIMTTANFLIPCATIGITSAIIRFGLERSNNKSEVFSISLLTLACGFLLMLVLSPLLGHINGLGEYKLIIMLYVLVSSTQQVCHQFVRARGHVRLYALDGVFRTIMTIVFSFIFLSIFRLGIIGYVMGIMCADILSIVCLFLIDDLHRFIHLRSINPYMTRSMLCFSIPLIPTTICNLILSMSDRLFLLNIRGPLLGDLAAKAEVGLYSVSNKIPTVLVLVSSIFIEAWQISTIKDSKRDELEGFFTTVGNMYQALIFLLISGVIMCSKLAVILFASPDFYNAWIFIPFLVIGSGFLCLSNFLNSIYTLEKKSISSFTTVLCGALMNIVLNVLMIPSMGAFGASLATMISYVFMFLIRVIHTRRYIPVHWKYPRVMASCILLALQCVLMLREGRFWLLMQVALCLLIFALNGIDILNAFKKVMRRRTA